MTDPSYATDPVSLATEGQGPRIAVAYLNKTTLGAALLYPAGLPHTTVSKQFGRDRSHKIGGEVACLMLANCCTFSKASLHVVAKRERPCSRTSSMKRSRLARSVWTTAIPGL